MLLFPRRICRDSTDIVEVQAPFDTGGRAFLWFSDTLQRMLDALVLRENFPNGTGGTW